MMQLIEQLVVLGCHHACSCSLTDLDGALCRLAQQPRALRLYFCWCLPHALLIRAAFMWPTPTRSQYSNKIVDCRLELFVLGASFARAIDSRSFHVVNTKLGHNTWRKLWVKSTLAAASDAFYLTKISASTWHQCMD